MIVTIPESWEDITVAQYTELSSVGIDYNTIKSLVLALTDERMAIIGLASIDVDEFDKIIKVLSIILDIAEDELLQVDQADLLTILKSLQGLTELPYIASGYDFKTITVGRWINIEEAIKGDASNNIGLLLHKLLDIDLNDILSAPITKYYNYVIDFGTFRKNTYTTYESMFIADEDDNTADLTAEELKNIERAKQWNWYGFLYSLAGGDFLKMHEVSDKNFIGALNYLSYKKQLR